MVRLPATGYPLSIHELEAGSGKLEADTKTI
jgi:hypothetical protein